MSRKSALRTANFYPRSPRGERPQRREIVDTIVAFLPALPARGATIDTDGLSYEFTISTRAPREGSDGSILSAFPLKK